LLWTKWRWGRFSPSTSVFLANLHSINLHNHHHLLSGACTIGQLWPQYQESQSHNTKNSKKKKKKIITMKFLLLLLRGLAWSDLFQPENLNYFYVHLFRVLSLSVLWIILSHVWVTRDDMTSSCSDDWILLALQLQILLITPRTCEVLHFIRSVGLIKG
jgi:hypothetical protein